MRRIELELALSPEEVADRARRAHEARQRVEREHPDLLRPINPPANGPPPLLPVDPDSGAAREGLGACIAEMAEIGNELSAIVTADNEASAAERRVEQVKADLDGFNRVEGERFSEWARERGLPKPTPRSEERAELQLKLAGAEHAARAARARADELVPAYARAREKLVSLEDQRRLLIGDVLSAELVRIGAEYYRALERMHELGTLVEQLRAEVNSHAAPRSPCSTGQRTKP